MKYLTPDRNDISPVSRFRRLYALFESTFQDLGIVVTPIKNEELTTRVYIAMENRKRLYHSTAHIFDLAKDLHPIQTLAAIYHDVIYTQVDNGLPAHWDKLFESVRDPRKPENLRKNFIPNLKYQLPLNRIFAIDETLDTPLHHCNEYLSFLVAEYELRAFLTHAQITALSICISMTRPFLRPQGKDISEPARIEQLLTEWFLDDKTSEDSSSTTISKAELETTIHWAVDLANRDVSDFSEENVADFILGSWSLFPERDNRLRTPSTCYVSQFRELLQTRWAFLKGLDIHTIFKQYKNSPSAETISAMIKVTQRNIHTTILFLEARILSLAIIEAIYKRDGRNPLVSMVFGEHAQQGIEKHLPKNRTCSPNTCDEESTALSALNEKITSNFWFDRTGSKLAHLVLLEINHETRQHLLQSMDLLTNTSTSDKSKWIANIPDSTLELIENALSNIEPTRKAHLDSGKIE